jgi:FkbM family methyltransferase
MQYLKRAKDISKYMSLASYMALRRKERHAPGETKLLGKKVFYSDACTFLEGVNELFLEESYWFPCKSKAPFILDCGCNIGLSTLYFKTLHPSSQILAFEPDAKIHSIFERNIKSFGLENVTAIKGAIWTANGELQFISEGGYSGRVDYSSTSKERVRACRLRDYLDRPVDFLKLDIEGCEVDVLLDCADRLKNIQCAFIEYHSPIHRSQRLSVLLELLEKNGFRHHVRSEYAFRSPLKDLKPMVDFDNQLSIHAWKADV